MWWGVNILSKFQLPSSNGFGVMSFEGLKEKEDLMNEIMNQSMTKVFVEQPWLHRVC